MDTFLKVLGALFLLGVLAFGGCVVIGGVAFNGIARAESNPVVTLQEFNSLKNGMSYQEAARVIGQPGEVMSENELAGIHTVMYSWTNGFSNMNAMFQNDKLMQKAQFGLK